MSHRPDVEAELGFDPVHRFWDTPLAEQNYGTWGGTLDPMAGTGYTGIDSDMFGFDWWNPRVLAQSYVDVMDPVYGEGGALEPVTVWIDPDRTWKDEYIDPTLDEYGNRAAAGTALVVIGLLAVASILK